MLTRSEASMRQARKIGRVVFAGRWNLAELLNDAASVAWELERRAPPHVGPGPIACIACKRVKSSRVFPKRSIRSIDTGGWQPKSAKRPKFTRSELTENLAAPGVDPADLACFILDYKAWLRQLSPRYRRIAKLLSTGESTQSASRRESVSQSRISQIRRLLQRDWEEFQGQN